MLSEFYLCEKYNEQYRNLSALAKVTCLDEFVNVVIPYDTGHLASFETTNIKEIEGAIYYMLADTAFTIDADGHWLYANSRISEEQAEKERISQYANEVYERLRVHACDTEDLSDAPIEFVDYEVKVVGMCMDIVEEIAKAYGVEIK